LRIVSWICSTRVFFFGPILAAILSNGALEPWFHLATPFACNALFILIGIGWLFVFFTETKEKRSAAYIPSEKAFAHFLDAFTDRQMRNFYGINFFFYLAIFGFLRAYPMHLVQYYHLSIPGLAICIVWVAIPIILAPFWISYWAKKRFSTKSLLISAGAITSFCMIFTAFHIFEAIVWIAFFVTAFGVGCCMNLCPYFISHKSRHELYGEVLAHDETLRTGTEAIATLTVGFLAAVFIPLPLYVFAITALIGTLFLALKNKDKLGSKDA